MFELILHYTNLGRHQVAKFVLDVGASVELFANGAKVDKVLRIGLGQFACWNLRLIVDLLVLINCFSKKLLCLSVFGVKVGLVRSTNLFSKGFSLVIFLHCQREISDSQIHALSLITSLVIL